MLRQKPWHLPTAEANFECCAHAVISQYFFLISLYIFLLHCFPSSVFLSVKKILLLSSLFLYIYKINLHLLYLYFYLIHHYTQIFLRKNASTLTCYFMVHQLLSECKFLKCNLLILFFNWQGQWYIHFPKYMPAITSFFYKNYNYY